MQAYFDTPLELLRVRIESAFENDYDVDNPTGLFADCLVNIARTVKRMETVLNSWRENDNSEPIEKVLEDVRHAVGLFVVREFENGRRSLDEYDEEYIHDCLEPYLAE